MDSPEQIAANEAIAKVAAEEAAKKAAVVEPVAKTVAPVNTDAELSLDVVPAAVTLTQVSGVKVIDDIGALLASKGLATTNDIMKEFTETGELSVASQSAIVDSVGADVASLVIKQLNDTAATGREASKKSREDLLDYTQKAFESAGATDKDLTWTQVQEFVKSPESGFTPADKAAFNKMLAGGGLQAQLVIDKIASVYFSLDSSTSHADLVQGDTHSSDSFKAISKAEYVSKLREVVKEFGEHSPQANALDRQREFSRQRGH